LSSNIIDFVRAGSKGTRQDINKILAELQDLNAEDPEDAALQERIALWDSRRKKTSSIEVAGAASQISAAGPRHRRTEEVTMQMPTACQSFPHTVTDFNVFEFPASIGETKFGGACIFDGLGSGTHTQINHIAASDLDLERTDSFSIATFVKRGNVAVPDAILYKKDSHFVATIGWFFGLTLSGEIRFGMSDGTNQIENLSSSDQDDDLWHSAVSTYDGTSNVTGMNMYIDGTLDNNSTVGTTVSTTIKNTVVTSIGAPSNPATFLLGGELAWLMIFKEELTSTWVTEFNAGHFDFSGGNLIFMAPYVGESKVFGEANTPYCVSS